VIFAGTPHRGSDKAKWASSATRLAAAIQKDHSSRMSKALERGSSTLEELQDWFKRIQNNFHIFTFVEDLPCPKIGKIVEADSVVINCDHEKKRLINANHMEMVKFDSENCNEYKKVKDVFTQIHQHISADEMRGVSQPGRLDSNRGSFVRSPDWSQSRYSTRTLEESRPRLSIQQGVPTFQQQMNELGRVNTIRSEEHVTLSPRQTSYQSPGPSSPRPSSDRLVNRASTTTLGTIASGTSRHSSSQSVPRIREQEPPSTERSEYRKYQQLSAFPVLSGTLTKGAVQVFDQGKMFSRQRDRNFAKNLITASQCFKRALALLPADADRSDFASTHYQLMGVEFEMAFHRDMAPQEKLSHLRTAEQHGWDASNNARQSTNSGLLAQVQLYMAVIKGRSAEINERLGVGAQEIRRQKDDALSEIAIAIEKVRELRPARLQESDSFAETWNKRLRPPSPPGPNTRIITTPPAPPLLPGPPNSMTTNSPPAHSPPPYFPMSSTIIIPSTAELDTIPPYSNTIPPYAELDTSGQLTTARYLHSEYASPLYTPGGL